MNTKSFRTQRTRGSALISALGVVAMTSLLMSGVCLLATSHVARQREEGDYALSIQMAEAGVNYEINYLGANQTTSTGNNIAFPGIPASSFNVISVTNVDGSAWVYPNDALITAIGTVGSTTRKVQVTAKSGGNSLFSLNALPAPGSPSGLKETFTIFGTQSVTLKGNGSALNGDTGCTGSITISGNGDSSTDGYIVLAGPGASISGDHKIDPARIQYSSQPINFPTIDQIVTSKFPAGWSSLSSPSALVNQAGRMRQFVSSLSTTVSPGNTKVATWATSGSAAVTMSDTNVAKNIQSTLILTPGDYYFTDFNLSSCKLILDTANLSTGGSPGQIKIWMSNSTSNDDITGNMSTTSTDPSLFRLYYDKPNTLSWAGNGTFVGAIYAVRAGRNGIITPGTIALAGNGSVSAEVIADKVTLVGNGNVALPTPGVAGSLGGSTGGMGNMFDMTMPGSGGYGFSTSWVELAASGASVFSDSTNN